MQLCTFNFQVKANHLFSVFCLASCGIHLILKENASFAMDLSGNYDKLTPAVSNLPNLKSFSCLASFGIEGESIPNEMSSLTFETEEQVSTLTFTPHVLKEIPKVCYLPYTLVRFTGLRWRNEEYFTNWCYVVFNHMTVPFTLCVSFRTKYLHTCTTHILIFLV